MQSVWNRVAGGVAAFVVLGAAVMLPSVARAQSSGSDVPAGLRAAIESFIEAKGLTYAGLCNEIVQHEHHNEICAMVQLGSGAGAEVFYGPVASDDISQETFILDNGQWRAEVAEPAGPISIPDSLRDAIKDFLEGKGLDYAGLCSEIVPHEHYGQYCAGVEILSETSARVYYAPVATDEFGEQVFIFENGAWIAEPEMSDPDPEPTPSDPQPTPADPIVVPGDLREAIKDFIEGKGLTYAGLCNEIVQHEHHNEICAMVLSNKDGKAEVSYGRVASDALAVETFVEDESGWRAGSEAPDPGDGDSDDPTSTPPSAPTPDDGDSDEDAGSDDGDVDWLPFALLGLGLVVAGGAGAGVTYLARHR